MNSIFPHEKVIATGNLSFKGDINSTSYVTIGGFLYSIF
jgi:hypothetical protein